MKGGFFLDIVISQSPAIFKLLARKYQTLLIRWNPFLVLLSETNNSDAAHERWQYTHMTVL